MNVHRCAVRGGGVDREREQRRHHLARDHRMTTDRLL
jgi:hypothetical protein